MTYQELYDILAQTGLPMALHHWEHPPKPPLWGVLRRLYRQLCRR